MSSFIKERQTVIDALLSLGLSPLPVAPYSSTLFNGKCPSYIENGKPKLVKHSLYRHKQPTQEELDLWFESPLIGIGCLGNDSVCWIDLDRKHFENQEGCDNAYQQLIENNPILKQAWLEKTHSGGYRIGINLATPKTFTNFRLSDSGHVGEALGAGRFTVLAPTIGKSGNNYQNINRPSQLPVVESLESLGIFPIAGKELPNNEIKTTIKFDVPSKYISLLDCVSKTNRDILEGKIQVDDDKSFLFTKAVKDLLGWANWLDNQQLNYSQNPLEIIRQAGANIGFSNKRIDYILSSIKVESCQPSALYAGGNDACIAKVNKLLGYQNKTDSQEYFDKLNWENWKKSKQFNAAKIVHEDLFEFPQDMPEHNAIIAVKSGLGTGKTEAILRMISSISKGCLLVGYRNNLLHQTISRGNELSITISHINEDGIVSENNEEISEACCINSLYKVDGKFKGRTIVIDETISVLLHLLEGGTFKTNEQKRAMNLLEVAFKEADRVFLMDGNLTDDAVRFLSSFVSEKKLYTIENTKKIAPHNIIFVDGGEVDENGDFTLKSNKKSHLIKHLSQSDIVPFIATDSKTFAHNLQEYLIKNGKSGIVISADTVQEKYAREFLENPDGYIERHKPQFVIITPSCESGVSITIKNYFTAKYSFFCGVLGSSSQHQMMFRLRDNCVPHYVFCPEKSLIRSQSIPMGYSQEAIKSALLERISLSSLMAIDVAGADCAKEIISNALESMKGDRWFDFSCKVWGLGNYERQNLRKCLAYSLEQAGHNVSFDKWGINQEIEDGLAEIKTEQIEKEALLQFNAMPFESMEECRKYENQDVNVETRRRILKTKLLLETLPGIEQASCYSVELFKRRLQERDFIGKHQNFSRLVNFEFTQKKLEETWFYGASAGKYKYIGSFFQDYKQTRISALNELGILDLLTPGKEFTKESQELIDLFAKVNNSHEMLTLLNIKKRKSTESQKEIIELFKQLLGFIGIELAKPVKKINENGDRLRHYEIDWDRFNDPIRLAIIKLTTIKDLKWLENHSEMPWQLPEDMQVDNLTKKYKEAARNQDYAAYSQARIEVESEKIISKLNGLTEEQMNNNNKIDRILMKAWDRLNIEEQKAILDLRPAPDNYLEEIDSKLKRDNHYSDEYLNYQKSQNSSSLWQARLRAATSIGKEFAKKLINDFFARIPQEDDRYLETFEYFEKEYLKYA